MRDYAEHDYALDLEEHEFGIRCMAAPIRDLSGTIIVAVSISVAVQYIDDERVRAMVEDVRSTAEEISRELGRCCNRRNGLQPENQRAI